MIWTSVDKLTCYHIENINLMIMKIDTAIYQFIVIVWSCDQTKYDL